LNNQAIRLYPSLSLLSFADRSDGENSDQAIGEASVEVLLVLGEDKGNAANGGWGLEFLGGWGSRNLVSVDELLVWQVVDSDAVVSADD